MSEAACDVDLVQLVYDLVDQIKAMRSVITQGDDEVNGPLDDYTQAIVTDADSCIVEGQRFLNANGRIL